MSLPPAAAAVVYHDEFDLTDIVRATRAAHWASKGLSGGPEWETACEAMDVFMAGPDSEPCASSGPPDVELSHSWLRASASYAPSGRADTPLPTTPSSSAPPSNKRSRATGAPAGHVSSHPPILPSPSASVVVSASASSPTPSSPLSSLPPSLPPSRSPSPTPSSPLSSLPPSPSPSPTPSSPISSPSRLPRRSRPPPTRPSPATSSSTRGGRSKSITAPSSTRSSNKPSSAACGTSAALSASRSLASSSPAARTSSKGAPVPTPLSSIPLSSVASLASRLPRPRPSRPPLEPAPISPTESRVRDTLPASSPASLHPPPSHSSLASSTSETTEPLPRRKKARRGTSSKPTHRGKAQDLSQLAAKHAANTVVKTLAFDFAKAVKTTKSAFSGARACPVDAQGLSLPELCEEARSFVRYDFDDNRPLILKDRHGRIFAIRADVPKWLSDLHPSLLRLLRRFQARVKSMDHMKNLVRGLHDYFILGIQRQYSSDPTIISFQKQFIIECEELLSPTFEGRPNPLLRLIGFINGLLATHAPGVYQRMMSIDNYLSERPFGAFHLMCINMPGGESFTVLCKGHKDWKNVPYYCCVVALGKFNSGLGPDGKKRRVYLCLWEAKILIEVPPCGILFYPSALFFHFNVDFSKLDIRVSEEQGDGRSTWIEDDARISIVFFTQASMFQLSELGGMTVKEATKKGLEKKGGNEARRARVFDEFAQI